MTHLSAEELAFILEEGKQKVLVVDCREDDFEGGHIKGALNVPFGRWQRDFQGAKDLVLSKRATLIVFHCMKSQVRGPYCMRKFMESAEIELKKLNAEVFLLRDGFEGFSRRYGVDNRTCEKFISNYNPKIWNFSFFDS